MLNKNYQKPLILVGNGVRTAHAVDLLHKFVLQTNIPVLTTMLAVDIVPNNMKLGFIGTHGNRVANMVLNECDLLISIGARLSIRQVGKNSKNFAPKADLIRCDIDEAELARNIKSNEYKYHSDAKDFITYLSTENWPVYSRWWNQCFSAKNMLKDFDVQIGNLAVKEISSLLPCDPIITVDVGMHQCWCAQSLELKGFKGRIITSCGYGTMGCALPYAIGASIANRKKHVFCIAGDGGFQMNIQELEVIQRECLPIKMFILNNRVLAKISETQHYDLDDRFANTTHASGYTVPDFAKIAAAYNIKSFNIANYKNLYKYEEWISNDMPCLFNIAIPENSFLTPKIKFETGEIRPKIDDQVYQSVVHLLQS